MGKLCAQLIKKLVALLQKADPDKLYDTEAKQAKRNDLEKLFDAQIATFKDLGTPEQIVEILQNQKSAVLKKSSEMTFGDGNIPFLPIIPRSFRSPYDLMAMVRNGGKAGYTCLNPTAISDVVETPSEPYYIYDVEDGNATRGKSPENAEEIFKQQKRSPLTAAEVMAFTVHTDVLFRHYVWAAGSRYGSVAGCRMCTSMAAIGRSSIGSGRTSRLRSGARPLAVVARALDFGPSGLLVFGLWLPPQFFHRSLQATRQGQFDAQCTICPFFLLKKVIN